MHAAVFQDAVEPAKHHAHKPHAHPPSAMHFTHTQSHTHTVTHTRAHGHSHTGWLKAAVLWFYALSSALGLQRLAIQLGLNGLLPGMGACACVCDCVCACVCVCARARAVCVTIIVRLLSVCVPLSAGIVSHV